MLGVNLKAQFRAEAKDFVAWLASHLDDQKNDCVTKKKLHRWVAASNRAAKNKGDEWSCSSLFDAYQNYYWRSVDPSDENSPAIFTFTQSEKCLERLGKDLDHAINNNEAKAAIEACEHILKWGGVSQRKVANLIRSLDEILPAYLADVRTYLKSSDWSTPFVTHIKGREYALEVDSGTTKIYSLLDSRWAIYDSRVGAALGLLVRMWAEDTNVQRIPEVLKFAWGYDKKRNPNRFGDSTFPKFGSKVDRFDHNRKLNWLLEFLLESESQFDGLSQSLRALEAALFMIGYCVQDPSAPHIDPLIDLKGIGAESMENKIGTFRIAILDKFGSETNAVIPTQKSGTFNASLTEAGIEVSNLGDSKLLEWRVFDEVERLLKNQGGSALRGNAHMGRLGDDLLPFNSVEGHVAKIVYGKLQGDSVFRRITPVANILVWAGVCDHGKESTLKMIQ